MEPVKADVPPLSWCFTSTEARWPIRDGLPVPNSQHRDPVDVKQH